MNTFEQQGFALWPKLIDAREVAVACRALERAPLEGAGARGMLELRWCRALAARVKARLVQSAILPAEHVAVQCTLFDKRPDKNWLVALHQDVSIPVNARVPHPALGAWSEKEGVPFVQAPRTVLEALRVVPGSHKQGQVDPKSVSELRETLGETTCLANRGDAVLMRPLTLHASSKSTTPTRRRILHFLFAPKTLPLGLEWRATAQPNRPLSP
jgi:ectoine hydroxylase-related dioxygenase (phytanoyl-CoA dioxygenase family)